VQGLNIHLNDNEYIMQIPSIDLFSWMLHQYPHAKYILSFSNSDGVSLQEFTELTGYNIPSDFDFGWDTHYGSDDLKKSLQNIYHCKKEEIVTTCGGTEANFLVFLSMLKKPAEIIVETPTYEPLWKTPLLLQATPIFWERRFEEGYALNLNELPFLITKNTKLIIITNLHNPSGVLIDKKTLHTLAAIAKEHNIYVLIDEIFLDATEKNMLSAWNLPNTIITSSVAKIYGFCGLRTGWIIAPKHLSEQFQQAKAHTTISSPFLSETITAKALTYARQTIRTRFQKKAQTNTKIIADWIKDHTDLFTWVPPDAGIICFPKYMLPVSSMKLCTYLLSKYQILVSPGSFFRQESHIRIGYNLEPDYLQDGLTALAQGVKALKNQM